MIWRRVAIRRSEKGSGTFLSFHTRVGEMLYPRPVIWLYGMSLLLSSLSIASVA